MIRHTVLFKWRPDTDPDEVAAFAEGLSALPASIEVIRRYEFGPDVGITDAAWDFALVADFDNEDGYREYADHPAHRAFIEKHVVPHVADLARVQYRLA